ncbi:glycoside hydrolase xylanase [Prevotella copri]|uniref:Glycoside hydrolase xylanase n=1 Tax=Segatella copri TaxID=165179 RepID=A0A646HPR4_9BACT|nr:PCMD domain-containing protein [Segatella copri]MQN89155.1 glycoside hydrolase xylanase [Segatella copri]MQO78803.1 glycoside hydrolase xylanase [Segatella copri]
MKQSRFIVAALSMSCITTLSSCFKEEPLNAECDIEQAYIHADNKILLNLLFTNPSDTLVNVQSDQTNIEFTMRPFAALTKQAPIFRLTPGATISPESGSLQDFSKGPVTYTVTSEDKQWSRTYQVRIKKGQTTMPNEIEFEFENAYLSKGYYNWQENWNGDILDIWATGNSGFNISNPSAKPEKYPTVMIEDGYKGKGVKLTTQRTSKLADKVHKPIAAGNLFIGQFDATDALLGDAMKATKFGHPFSFSTKPAKLEGWYKYQAGEKFTDKNMKELNRHDYGTIYAVLYENIDEKGNAVLLYGDNVQTSKQIVALALVGETHDDNGKVAIGNTPEWHHFSVDFEYKKAIDLIKLKNGGYSLSIVCSSSSDGANFLGAEGSTLWIDSFKLICK